MKKIIMSLISIMLLCQAASAFTLSIDPPSLWISVPPNQSKSGVITVENKGSRAIEVGAYTEDWVYAADRSKNFKKAGSTPFSCAKWISLFPRVFTVQPGRWQDVQYTITAPSGASGGYYGVIFFESRPEEDWSSKRSRVALAGRLGTIVYLETEGKSQKAASIAKINISGYMKNRPLNFTIPFRNEGDIILAPKGHILITDDSSKLYGRADLQNFYILPKETLPLTASWKGDLGAGVYNVIATVDFGGKEPITVQTKLYVAKNGVKSKSGEKEKD